MAECGWVSNDPHAPQFDSMKLRSLFLLPLLSLPGLQSQAAPLTLTGLAGNLLVSGSGATAVIGNAFANGDTISYSGTPSAAFTISVTGDIVPGAINLANTTNTITFGGTNSVTGTTYTKTGTGAVYFNTAMSFSGGISTGSGFTSTTTAATGNGLATQTGTLASLELFSLTSDTYNLTGDITLTNTASGNMLAFGGIGSGVNAAKTLTNNITLSSSAVQSRFVILGDANTNTAQAGKHDVILSGKISGGVTGATFYVNTDQSGSGASALKLTNATNDFTATIQVNRGGLAITSDAALGNSANSINLDVGVAVATGLRFDAAISSARNIALGGGQQNFNTNGNDISLSGVISGAGQLFKQGAGVLTLSGASANTYTGLTTVSAGTLRLGKASALGTTAGGTSVTSGAVLDLNGQTIGAEAVTINGTGISSGGALINSSGTAASLSGAVTLGSNASIGGTGSTTLSGVVSGAFALTKVGSGTLVLSNSGNSHSSTTLNAGTLSLGNATALGSGTLTHAGGTLSTTTLTANTTISNAITLSGTGDRTLLMYGTGNGSNTVEYSGQITGSATRLFLNNNQAFSTNPQFILSNATNNFTANVNINRGGLRIASNAALGNLANTVTFDSNDGADLTFANAMTYTRATTLSTATDFDTGANAVTASGVISGGNSLTKIGSGTLTLTNANTYAGATTINGGTLALSGSGSLASNTIIVGANTTFDVSAVTGGYTLGSGKTITSTGTIVGNITIGSGATLAPGNSPGDLSFADNLGLLGTLNLEITGITLGAFDRLLGDGANTLTLGGLLNLNNTGYTAVLGNQVTVFSGWNSIAGSFSSITGTDLGGGLSWDTSMLASTGVLTVIPEPGAALLGGLGMLALLRRRR
jgi:fibronectin-binding autotransporter adhesin